MKSIIAAAIRKDKQEITAVTGSQVSNFLKSKFMARNTNDNKQVSNTSNNSNKKDRKGDTERTSNQGRKEASGGSVETNNRGHKKGI
jgi:hypothetical protein